MIIFFIIFALLFITGVILLIIILREKKEVGVLGKPSVYSDTELQPGEILYASDIQLCGKPDYVVQENGYYLPVEVKTGRTPTNEPYQNHVMQLMAYCYLAEEKYASTIRGGIIKYPDKEYRVQYTDEARRSVEVAVSDILKARESGEEFSCQHANHNH